MYIRSCIRLDTLGLAIQQGLMTNVKLEFLGNRFHHNLRDVFTVTIEYHIQIGR